MAQADGRRLSSGPSGPVGVGKTLPLLLLTLRHRLQTNKEFHSVALFVINLLGKMHEPFVCGAWTELRPPCRATSSRQSAEFRLDEIRHE